MVLGCPMVLALAASDVPKPVRLRCCGVGQSSFGYGGIA
jgi:hypothetical protein